MFNKMIYISCNPDTLKRDIELLKDRYSIDKFALFDQFPHTTHIESALYLNRR